MKAQYLVAKNYIVRRRGYLNIHLVFITGRTQAKTNNKEEATSITTAPNNRKLRNKNKSSTKSYTSPLRARSDTSVTWK